MRQNDGGPAESGGFVIGGYQAGDAPGIALVEENCFSLPWSARALEHFASLPQARLLKATLDGQVVGYVGAYLILDTADITNLGVLAPFRGKGAGSALLRGMMALLEREGGRLLQLEVRRSHSKVLAFYERHGFVQNGLRKDFYQKPVEDAVLMACPLGGAALPEDESGAMGPLKKQPL